MLVLPLGPMPASAQPFNHPGVLSSQAELDYMRDKINNDPSHPMRAGYNKMLEWTPRSTPSPVEIFDTSSEWHNNFLPDGHTVLWNAIRWVVTGNSNFANQAIAFCNAWAYTLREVRPFTDHSYDQQHRLNSAQSLAYWLAGAEIIRYYNNGAAGWAPGDIARFEAMLDIFWPVLHYQASCSGWSSPGCAYTDSPEFSTRDMGRVSNHETSYAAARLAISVFQNNRARFDASRDYYLRLLQRYIYPSGQLGETCRDCTHDAMGLVGLIYGAEICWQQGYDVYGETFGGTTPRLLLGMEYKGRQAYQSVPRICNGVSGTSGPCDPGNVTGWEIGLHHYKNRRGLSVPWSQKFTEEKMRPEDYRWNFVSWTTTTHAEGYVGTNPPPPGCSGPPAAPAGVQAVPGTGQVTVSWDAEPCANSYTVFRDGVAVAAGLTTTRFTDTNVVAGSNYCYAVRSISTNGPGPLSTNVCVMVGTGSCQGPPAAPGGVQAVPGTGQVTVSWDAELCANGYTVFRDGVAVAAGLTTTSFTDTNVVAGSNYCYAVRSVSTNGVGPLSSNVCVMVGMVLAVPQIHWIRAEGVGADTVVTIAAQGVPAVEHTLQRVGALDGAGWTNLQGRVASTNDAELGGIIFHDTNPPSPAFYRISRPPSP